MTKEKMIQQIVETHCFGTWATVKMILEDLFDASGVAFGAQYFVELKEEMFND
jgi:hypothetical protein